MKCHRELASWRSWRRGYQGELGFVPTLGGLHAGHEALIRRSVADNPHTVVSVFLNPTQFDAETDLTSYPAETHADLEQLQAWGVDQVLLPTADAIYPDQYRYRVSESDLSQRFCGAHRPGHFDGMLTVVLRLLNLTRPTRAYFGEKDYQQLQLVRGLVDAFMLDTEIVACATVRAEDGLALSSRNARLSPAQRALAPRLVQVLRHSADAESAAAELSALGFAVDYVEDYEGRRLAAAALGDVRLIDNVPLASPALSGVSTA